jgi:hypothetical protein
VTYREFLYLLSPAERRGVAQSVARGVWDAEVGGSSPLTPTMSTDPLHEPINGKNAILSNRDKPQRMRQSSDRPVDCRAAKALARLTIRPQKAATMAG